MAYVRFLDGPRAGERIALDKPSVSFGRSPSCDCVLAHKMVSRQHFFIERTGGKFLVVDNQSGNGTFTNGRRITWAELHDGDRIQAGPFTLTFEAAEDGRHESAAPKPEPEAKGIGFAASHWRDYPREYLQGIWLFNAGRYFEAHEVWEEVWLRARDEAKLFYQMLIQAAVGLHHYERGNARGARGMYRSVTEKLARLPRRFMSLDLQAFESAFRDFFAELTENPEATPVPRAPKPRIELMGGE